MKKASWRYLSLVVLAAAAMSAGCEQTTTPETCALPRTTAVPPAGQYPIKDKPTVQLNTNVPATVYLTLDGTQPRQGYPNTFALRAPVRGIPIAYNGMPLRYFAVDDCGNQELARLAVYNLDGPPETRIIPEGGLFAEPVTAVLTASEAATVYYTLDGSEPDPANPSVKNGDSPIGDIHIERTTTIRFASQDAAGNLEETKVANFQIDTVPPTVTVSPNGGSFTESVEVTITITNDTGKIYYTLSDSEASGGIPRSNDSSGRTRQGPGAVKLNLRKTTVVRYYAVDKVGNPEADLPAKGYKEAAFYVDCQPVAVADPPAGAFPGQTLTIALTGYPAGGTVYYRKDDAAPQVYGTPIVLTNVPGAKLEYWNDAVIDSNCGSSVQSGDHTIASYTLGADIPSSVFTEEFTSTTRISQSETTAVVDTVAGVVRLPYQDVEEADKEENTVAQSPASVILSQIAFSNWVNSGLIAAVEGLSPFGGQTAGATTNRADAGLKLYTMTDVQPTAGPSPELTFVAAYKPGTAFVPQPVYYDVALVRSGSGVNIATVAALSEVQFIDVSSPASPVLLPAVISTNPGGAYLITRDDLISRLYVVNPSGTGDFNLSSYDIATTSDTPAAIATVGVANEVASDVVLENMDVFDWETGYNRVLVLAANCRVYRFDTPANGSISASSLSSVDVCERGSGDVPRKVSSFVHGSKQYLFTTVVQAGGGGAVSLIRTSGEVVEASWTQVLPADLSAQISGIAVVAVASGSNGYALAVFDGADLHLYDLAGVDLLTTDKRLAQLTVLDTGTRSVYDARGLGNGFLVGALAAPGGGGGALLLRVPDDAKTKQDSAIVTSVDINPQPGRNLRTVQFLEAVNKNNEGTLSYEIKVGSGDFQAMTLGNAIAVSTATDALSWRAKLKMGAGAKEPILDRLQFKLTYPEDQ